MRKVLIANRGEIAVRIARACRDAGLAAVAVYADSDRDAVHVRAADEAFALHGESAAETYLDVTKIIAVAARCGADAVHPGYGFGAERADFAQAVVDAGLIWIGPAPSVIRQLGDKAAARRLAARVGVPTTPGSPGPVTGPEEIVEFVRRHGLPVAIKAVHGGGGRGLKVVRHVDEIPERYASAVREAVASFGSGECLVERYLQRPRHVETQCLADEHGGVVVVSTRDCTLQRRHQKVVEEAPAPFLTAEQTAALYAHSKAILWEVGYTSAATCEFLVAADGTLAFLEVNTRLQVEHPVSEEVTGIDLVGEMLRIAAGEPLGYDDPAVRGHAIEFRINGEDPGNGFLPDPGTVTHWEPAAGPGVRVDAGVRAGSVVGTGFDSLLGKLIVTGRTREHALRRARRALAEFEVGGVATLLPLHRAVVDDPDFAPADPATPFAVHTGWIESVPVAALPARSPAVPADPGPPVERITVEVDGRRLEVGLPAGLGAPVPRPVAAVSRAAARGRGVPARALAGAPNTGPERPVPSAESLVAPMQGVIVRLAVTEGQRVVRGDEVAVLEAMKMEQSLRAHRDGVVCALAATLGESVALGSVVCRIED